MPFFDHVSDEVLSDLEEAAYWAWHNEAERNLPDPIDELDHLWPEDGGVEPGLRWLDPMDACLPVVEALCSPYGDAVTSWVVGLLGLVHQAYS